jgi:hypothetical protein
MRTKVIGIAALFSIVALLGAGIARAQSAPATVWLVAKVEVGTNNDLSFVRGASRWSVNAPAVGDILRTFDGSYVYARVTPNGSALDVDAVAGQNQGSVREKVQGATDDYGAIAWIRPGAFFVIKGQTQSEEEEGALWYYDVPVRSGGLSADPHTGYVLQDDVIVWSWKP